MVLQPSPTSAVYNAHGKTKVGLKRKLSEEERVRQLVRETIKYACFLLLIAVFGIIFFSYRTKLVLLFYFLKMVSVTHYR
jgi:L-asparagine transporter-like permease